MAASVAMRPAHTEIGRRCGWNTFAFDNGLEDFFKNPAGFDTGEFIEGIRAARQNRPALWIDLTGSAASALAIKASGASRVAARITRGGRSLVDHRLPHTVQENEYGNRDRVAAFLGCDLDFRLPQQIRLNSPVEVPRYVVLCLTTACRWKNWPLANFHMLVQRFPRTRFVAVGLGREIPAEEREELDRIVAQPNVINRMDRLSTVELVDLIAQAAAVVTNDTSAAHIANFFGKSGAVLFGPVSPKTFASPNGLRVFHDATCPYHPCVQWRCANEANWCMRKIDVSNVASHLAGILKANAGPALLPAEPAHEATYQPDWQRQSQLPV